MTAIIAMVLPMFTIGLLLLAVLVIVPRRRKLVALDADAFPSLARLRNVTLTSRIIGVVLGIIAILAVNSIGRHGLGAMLAPAVFAATQILATLAAGIITHNTARTPGTAGLEVRRVRSYLPTALTTLTASVTVLLATALVWTTVVASADDRGIAGRAFTWYYPCEYDSCSSASTPWPGSFYSGPLAIALIIVLIAAATTIIVTVRRPRNASDPEILRVDDVIRSRSVESVIAAVGVAIAGSLFAVSVLIGVTLGPASSDIHGALRGVGVSAAVIAVASLILMSWCVVVLLLPGARAARTEAARVSAPAVAGER